MTWDLKCDNCGFEFIVSFPDDEVETFGNEIRQCPCGNKMRIVSEEMTEEGETE